MTKEAERIGHYRIVRELGRDGLSAVLLAVDEILDRNVVLRIVRLAPIFLPDQVEASREEFRRFARLAARVTHPNLVTVYAFEPFATTDLIVTEFVEGETLRHRVGGGARMSPIEAGKLGIQLADALAAAHDAGLAHGRINLSNLVVQTDGRIRILDLGMPKLVLGLGSIRAGDPSEDVAALAGVLVALITGGDPWEAKVRNGAAFPPWLRDDLGAAAELGAIAPALRRAMRMDGSLGYPDGAAFRAALRAGLDRARRLTPDTTAAAPHSDTTAPTPLDVDTAAPAADEPSGTRLILPIGLADEPIEPQPDPVRPRARLAVSIALAVTAGVALVAGYQLFLADRSASGTVALAAAEATPGAASPSTIDPVVGAGSLDSATAEIPGAPTASTDSVRPRPVDRTGLRTATITAAPTGASITVFGRSGTNVYENEARITVAGADSLTVRVEKSGYVPQTLVFAGEPVRISLRPDSVTARFESNARADVFIVEDGRNRRIGTTPVAASLPTGRHTFRFRAPGQPEWETTMTMPTPGETYRVAKTDYAVFGSVVVSIVRGWALVSLDGGEERQSPVVFDNVRAGRHIIRVRREGFATIVDTVVVQPGEIVRRPFTLRPGR